MSQRTGLNGRISQLGQRLWQAVEWIADGVEGSLPSGRLGRDVQDAEDKPEGITAPATLIELPKQDVFWTSITLPREAVGHRQRTAQLRMASLCPVPAEDVSFALGNPSPMGKTQIRVPIAIVRKETLLELTHGNDNLRQVVARPDSGPPVSLFRRERKGVKKWLLRGAVVYGAILATLIGFTNFTERWIVNEQAEFAERTALLKSAREDLTVIETYVDERKLLPWAYALGMLGTLPFSDEVALNSLSVRDGEILAQGYFSPMVDPSTLSEYGQLNLADEDREGWQKFTYTEKVINDD